MILDDPNDPRVKDGCHGGLFSVSGLQNSRPCFELLLGCVAFFGKMHTLGA